MSMKTSDDTIANRTRDLPVCSAVLQPTKPPRASNYSGILQSIYVTSCPCACNEGPEEQLHALSVEHLMDWSGHIHAPTAFPPEKQPPAPSNRRKSGCRVDYFKKSKISCPGRESNHDHSVVRPVAQLLSLFTSNCQCAISALCSALYVFRNFPLRINPLQTKRRPPYLKAQSVPRCKHFSSRL